MHMVVNHRHIYEACLTVKGNPPVDTSGRREASDNLCDGRFSAGLCPAQDHPQAKARKTTTVSWLEPQEESRVNPAYVIWLVSLTGLLVIIYGTLQQCASKTNHKGEGLCWGIIFHLSFLLAAGKCAKNTKNKEMRRIQSVSQTLKNQEKIKGYFQRKKNLDNNFIYSKRCFLFICEPLSWIGNEN